LATISGGILVSYKILLADDSVTVQKIITLTFSDEGVDVLAVNNGDDAIQRLQYMRPALVMADVSIPGRNGYEICEFVKSHPEMKNTPVVLLVPAFEPFDEERARRIGADFHLTKPFQSIRTLISTVKNLIEPEAPRPSIPPAPSVNQQAAAQIDTKSAKIEELIRQSATSTSDAREQDPLSGIGLEQSEFVRAASQPHEEPRLYDPSSLTVVENHRVKMSNESIALDSNASTNVFDDILELDDVLPELSHTPEVTTEIGSTTPPAANAHQGEGVQTLIIPQSVVDEIVNRVVAQLSQRMNEILVEKLAERLSSILAPGVAPDVAEIVNRPQFTEARARRGTDNLLEID